MNRTIHLIAAMFALSLVSCKNESTHSYAISDFSTTLRPIITKMVSKGIVMANSSFTKSVTDEELRELSRCEHPVLRASALREMLHRKSFDHFQLVMGHLDDTALVRVDKGEFGVWLRMVSDDLLQEAAWKTQHTKDTTIESVLTKHNYLRSAYLILLQIPAQEKFYPFIKNMAIRPRRLSYDGYELDFDDIEYALYGLAAFKRKDDIQILKTKMMDNSWRLSNVSFRLMTDFPDTAYLDVLQAYHRRQFYQFSGNRRNGFSGIAADRADPEDFIKALVVQQNTRSAALIDTMVNRLPLMSCMPDNEQILDNLIMEIWDHPCLAYATLRKKIKVRAEKIQRGIFSFPNTLHYELIDTTRETIPWLR